MYHLAKSVIRDLHRMPNKVKLSKIKQNETRGCSSLPARRRRCSPRWPPGASPEVPGRCMEWLGEGSLCPSGHRLTAQAKCLPEANNLRPHLAKEEAQEETYLPVRTGTWNGVTCPEVVKESHRENPTQTLHCEHGTHPCCGLFIR